MTRENNLINVSVWSTEEQKALIADGASIYYSTGQTIREQQLANRPFWYVTNRFDEAGYHRLFNTRSRLTQVAIYSDPKRFFIPGSLEENMATQRELMVKDRGELRQRLGLANLDQTFPNASEATEIIFRHFDATGVKLLGSDHETAWLRTETVLEDSDVYYPAKTLAIVGSWALPGLIVDTWAGHGAIKELRAARWLTPIPEKSESVDLLDVLKLVSR